MCRLRASRRTRSTTLVAELGGCLRAVLRDVLCGHLDPALRRVADELVEQVCAHADETVEVVDVVLELGDDERRRVAERGAQPLDVRGVAGGQSRQLPVAASTRSVSVGPSDSATSSGSSSDGDWWTRLTTSPPNGIPASRSLRWKKIASSTGSWRGAVTIRNVVAGSSSSAPTRRARSVKPSIIPLSARKNADRSRSRSTPVIRCMTPKTTPVPRPNNPGGLQEHPDRAALEEPREPPRRVEEVERVAGGRRVEHEHVVGAGRSSS